MFKKLLNLFKQKPEVNLEDLGLIEDPRSDEEKDNDYRAEEITFSFSPIEWKQKQESEWSKFPIFYQDGSGSCVAQAVTKALGIENYIEEGKFVHYSARDIYTRRANYPGRGMWFHDGMKIGHKIGATFEQLMPSQGLNESVMNAAEDRTPLTEIAGKIGRGGNYVTLPVNIDAIASVIEHQKKGVVIGVRFGPKEWNRDVPKVLGDSRKSGHGVCATNAILYNRKKALIIEDSWGKTSGMSGRRIVTQDWFDAKKIVYAGYFKFLKNDGILDGQKPQHTFKKDLYYGLVKDPEVVMLQRCLAYLKFFPSNVDFTGNFYSITRTAVKAFQSANDIDPVKGFVGPITRAKLNQLFI